MWSLFWLIVFYNCVYGQVFNYSNVSPKELDALRDFYDATGGPYWRWYHHNESYIPSNQTEFYNRPIWNFTGEYINPCQPVPWKGVTCACDIQCNVTAIVLSFRNLTGTIPSSFLNLSHLNVLELSYNSLDEFPAILANQSSLRILDLTGNLFGGSIPHCIGLFTNLRILRLAFNHFNGSIPSSLKKLDHLEVLNLVLNNITDTLEPFTHLESIRDLAVSHNNLYGTLPSSLNQLRRLSALVLEDNLISGTLIDELWSMKTLQLLNLAENRLVGTIPISISELVHLRMINLSSNSFSGTFPQVLINMTYGALSSIYLADSGLEGKLESILLNISASNLANFGVRSNRFTGSLPRLDFPELYNFDVSDNFLTGAIPESICNLTKLTLLNLGYNYFQETIPECLGSLKLELFSVPNNELSGTLPVIKSTLEYGGIYEAENNILTGTIPNLCESKFHVVTAGGNHLDGTLPVCIFDAIGVRKVNVSFNYLDGTLPSNLGTSAITLLALNHNMFSGTLPDMSTAFALVFFYVQRNKLSGSLVLNDVNHKNLTSGKFHPSIAFIDCSNNDLTGTLPSNLFEVSVSLISFVATSNCFSGSIPDSICSSAHLVYLDLDGISTASKCRKPIFPGNKQLTSFVVTRKIDNNFPLCLFSMPYLNTLHLSGNNVQWSFPEHMNVSESLEYLDLSHNRLTGTIPKVIQRHPWKKLDLSYNKLVGFLDEQMSFSNQSSLTLQVNRLSGRIPGSIMDMTNINILNGNDFYCTFLRQGLPPHDPGESNYQCGSNSFSQAASLTGILAALILLLIVFVLCKDSLLRKGRHFIQRMKTFWYAIMLDEAFASFTVFIWTINRYVWICLCIILLVFLPLNTTLSTLYSSQSNQYAWAVSAAFVSGFVPGLILTLSYVGFILILNGMWNHLDIQRKMYDKITHHTHAFSWKQFIALNSVLLINAIATFLVNGTYVYVVLYQNAKIVLLCQFLVAGFKLMWNERAVKYLVKLTRKWYESAADLENPALLEIRTSQEMPYLTFMALFNVLIAPLVASAVVDPDCFVEVFVEPEPVTSTFPYYNCNFYQVQHDLCSSQSNSESTFTSTYSPPFIYSYQCSSSILTNYVAVFVLMFTFDMFLRPPLMWLTVQTFSKLSRGSWLYYCISKIIYPVLKKPDWDSLQNGRGIFPKDRFVLRFVSQSSILLTFGVLFPPLALFICGSYLSQSVLLVILIGRLLHQIEDPILKEKYREVLIQDTENCWGLFMDAMAQLVVPVASLFFALIVLDTYGDKVGSRRAAWMPAMIVGTPLVLYLVRKARACFKVNNLSENNPFKGRTSAVEMTVTENPLKKKNES